MIYRINSSDKQKSRDQLTLNGEPRTQQPEPRMSNFKANRSKPNHSNCLTNKTLNHLTRSVLEDEGNEVLSVYTNGECASAALQVPHYTMYLYHDGVSSESQAIFIRQDSGAVNPEVSSTMGTLKDVQANVKMLLSTNKCERCDLSRANLSGENLGCAKWTDGSDCAVISLGTCNTCPHPCNGCNNPAAESTPRYSLRIMFTNTDQRNIYATVTYVVITRRYGAPREDRLRSPGPFLNRCRTTSSNGRLTTACTRPLRRSLTGPRSDNWRHAGRPVRADICWMKAGRSKTRCRGWPPVVTACRTDTRRIHI